MLRAVALPAIETANRRRSEIEVYHLVPEALLFRIEDEGASALHACARLVDVEVLRKIAAEVLGERIPTHRAVRHRRLIREVRRHPDVLLPVVHRSLFNERDVAVDPVVD